MLQQAWRPAGERGQGRSAAVEGAVEGASIRRDRHTRRVWLAAGAGGAVPMLLLSACERAAGPGPAPATEAPATVQFYFSGDTATQQLYETLKETYERTYPKYKLELVHADSEIEKLLTLIAGGTPTDVFWNRVRTSQVLIRREGSLVDLLPLMKRDKLTQEDFWPSAVKAYSYKGGYYGLPTSASSNALYFNKEHFRQAGATFPTELEKQGKWTWDSLLETARKLTGPEPTSGQKRYGFLRPSGLVLTVQYIWQNGGTPFSEDRTKCLLTSPESVGAIEFITDMVLKHQVSPKVNEEGSPNFRTNFRVAMEQAGRYLLPGIVPALQSNTIDPGMVLAPKGPKAATTRGDDLAASILKSTKVPEAAWAFAKLWSSEEGQLIVLKSNRSYTARRSIARDQSILKQVLHPWEDGETYFTGLNRTEVFPVTPKFPEVMSIFAREERAAHSAEKTPRQAMEAASQEITPLLNEPF
ncbi:MAG: ABC transporter substrate-binding protein [Chloroflexota bacterium]